MLLQKYAPDLQILLFPSNQFGNQEPGSSQCARSFMHNAVPGVTVFDVADVVGPAALEIFTYLQAAAKPYAPIWRSKSGAPMPVWCLPCQQHLISWNYFKFIVDANGAFVPGGVYTSGDAPQDAEGLIRRQLGLQPLNSSKLLDGEPEPEGEM